MSQNAARKFSHLFPSERERIQCRPFVKWVGGKTQLLAELIKRMPNKINTYFEPFLGGGALLFALQPNHANVFDINPELINAYTVLKTTPDQLIEDLTRHIYEKDYFYTIRDIDRKAEYLHWSPVQRASRFIFLNKTCFNGLYRVNSKGFFNTPFGRYTNPTILDEANLRGCSQALQNVTIELASFEAFESRAKESDFVYFDPPYVPLSETSLFTNYSQQGFNMQMQQSLYELCCRLDARGVRFMLSNSSAPSVLKLYEKFSVELVSANRAINSKGSKRGPINEVVVTNY